MEVAVFPIPTMVCFPPQPVRLHVFEPRYRQMVQDCVATGRWLGVSLPKTVLREKKATGDLSKDLSSNQSTYESHEIFGAGPVFVEEVFKDGRMLIRVEIKSRHKVVVLKQHLPYFIAETIEIEDRDEKDDARFVVLDGLCKDILKEHYDNFKQTLPAKTFEESDLSSLSLGVFKWCRMEPSAMQRFLEMTSCIERAEGLIRILARYFEKMDRTLLSDSMSTEDTPPTLH